MKIVAISAAWAVALLAAGLAAAQVPGSYPVVVPQPVISISAVVSAPVANDRMHAYLRADVENPDPVNAANEVNTRMAKALARAKAVRGVEASTTNYSSYQISDKTQAPRWRVSQTLSLEAADFASLSALVSRIQAEDSLVLSGMNFNVSPATQRKAEDDLTAQAIKAWYVRAQAVAQGFGGASWRPGRITIVAGDQGSRPQPMYSQSVMRAAAAPVATEAGSSEVAVTVSGEVIVETVRAR